MSVRMSVVEAKKHISRAYHEMNQLMKSSQLITLAHKRRKDYIKKYGEMMYVALGERLGSTLHAVVTFDRPRGYHAPRQGDVKYPWTFWAMEALNVVDNGCGIKGEELFLALHKTLEKHSWDDVVRQFVVDHQYMHEETMKDPIRLLKWVYKNGHRPSALVYKTPEQWSEHMGSPWETLPLCSGWFEALTVHPELDAVGMCRRSRMTAPWLEMSFTVSETQVLVTGPVKGTHDYKIELVNITNPSPEAISSGSISVLVDTIPGMYWGLVTLVIGNVFPDGKVILQKYAYSKYDKLAHSPDHVADVNDWYVYTRAVNSGVTGYPTNKFDIERHPSEKYYNPTFHATVAAGQTVVDLKYMLILKDWPLSTHFYKVLSDTATAYVKMRNVEL